MKSKANHIEDAQKHLLGVTLQHQVMAVIVGKGTSHQKGLVEHIPQIRCVDLTTDTEGQAVDSNGPHGPHTVTPIAKKQPLQIKENHPLH